MCGKERKDTKQFHYKHSADFIRAYCWQTDSTPAGGVIKHKDVNKERIETRDDSTDSPEQLSPTGFTF